MRKNEDLQKDVQDAIKWEPLLNAAEIGVIVKDGVVTLTGIVDSYAKKSEAENAAKHVVGVKAVVEKIEIKIGVLGAKNDNEIATDVIHAFKWNWEVPSDKIKVKVEHEWVTLEGEVQWNYQKEAAKRSVNNIFGVKGVTNSITIKSETQDLIEQKDIERALRRNWSIDDKDIKVTVLGKRVTLNGTVDSLYQKDEASKIAWNAPGVLVVDNELIIA
ncbi:MAG: BON domain-containing protein [Bacteroidota bacterium]